MIALSVKQVVCKLYTNILCSQLIIMATESPSPRRPPPRPPKSQYLLDKEAEALATKLIVSHVSSISYPKGKNPFGESSEDESDLPENKGSLPQQSSASSKLTSSVPPKVSTNPFAECDSDDGEIDGKQSLFDADKAKPSQNFPGPQETPPFNPIAICKLDVKTKIDSEHDGESSNVDQASTVKVSSSNPFDDVTDNEEDEKSIEQGLVSMKEVKEEETPTEGPDEELVPPKPPRKRLAPRPPPYSNFSSDISGNMQTAMRFSLQTMNDSAEMSPSSSRASPAECRRLSTSCESVRVKGPAPSLPVGQKREIRAEGFIKYSRLMREVEEVNKCLVRYDEEVEALKAKVDGGKFLIMQKRIGEFA